MQAGFRGVQQAGGDRDLYLSDFGIYVLNQVTTPNWGTRMKRLNNRNVVEDTDCYSDATCRLVWRYIAGNLNQQLAIE